MRSRPPAPLRSGAAPLLLAGFAVDGGRAMSWRTASLPVVPKSETLESDPDDLDSLMSFGGSWLEDSDETSVDVDTNARRGPSNEPYADILMTQARKEEGYRDATQFRHTDRGSEPEFQMKFPRSLVKRIAKLRTGPIQRNIRFSFTGGMNRNALQRKRREWVLDFADRNFTEVDYLRISDAPAGGRPRGRWDHTFETPARKTVNDHDFDQRFWDILVASQFTLCPAGDNWWSFRFLEAILAGSIPIVDRPEEAMGPEGWAVAEKIPFKYYTLSRDRGFEYVYRHDWARENLYWLVHYFTYIHGDNQVPCVAPVREDMRMKK